MHIAIYDENPSGLDGLHQHITRFFELRELSPDISRFTSPIAFSAAMDEACFDLAFIALGQQSRSGFALARRLREQNTQCDLVFVSEYPEFMRDSIAYRPTGYLLQPVAESEAFSVLEQALFYQWHPNRYYRVHTRNQDQNIPHAEIRYFQSDGHRVLIHFHPSQAPLAHLSRLGSIERELARLDYLRCHQSYLVHLPYVRSLDRKSMKLGLTDGVEIPVSKRYLSHVTNALLARNPL